MPATMEEYVRLFFTGEPLQRLFACVCNSCHREVQYKVCRVVSCMLRTTLCIRLTPVGLAPFRDDITMVLPYTMMDRGQLDFLDSLLLDASFIPATSPQGDPVRAMGVGGEVVVVTMIDSMRVWSDSCTDRAPLVHRHGPPRRHAGGAADRAHRAKEDASRALHGRPVQGAMHWQLDTLDLLKALVACVFRSKAFPNNEMRHGICDIIVQMVIHEVGLTQNTVDELRAFIQGIQSV